MTKITDLPVVSVLPDDALVLIHDPTRILGDRSVAIEYQNLLGSTGTSLDIDKILLDDDGTLVYDENFNILTD